MLQTHWTAVLVDLQERSLRYCDSLAHERHDAEAYANGMCLLAHRYATPPSVALS